MSRNKSRHRKEGRLVDIYTFFMSVLAGVISNIICKMMDRRK